MKKFRSVFSDCMIYDSLPLHLLVKSSQSPSVDYNDFFVIYLNIYNYKTRLSVIIFIGLMQQ